MVAGLALKPTLEEGTWTYADPSGLQATDDSFLGRGLPTKEDPEKENSMRTWVRVGGGKQLEGRVEIVSEDVHSRKRPTTRCVAV